MQSLHPLSFFYKTLLEHDGFTHVTLCRYMTLWREGLKRFEDQAVETFGDSDVDDLSHIESDQDSYESDFIDDTEYPLSKQQIREFRSFPLNPSNFKNVLRNRPSRHLRATWDKINTMAQRGKTKPSNVDRLADEALSKRRRTATASTAAVVPIKITKPPRGPRQKTTATSRAPEYFTDSPVADENDNEEDYPLVPSRTQRGGQTGRGRAQNKPTATAPAGKTRAVTGPRSAASKAALIRQGRMQPAPVEIEDEDEPEEPILGPTNKDQTGIEGEEEPEEGEDDEGEEMDNPDVDELAEPDYANEPPPDASCMTPPEDEINVQDEGADTLETDDARIDETIPWQDGPEPSTGCFDEQIQQELAALGDAVTPMIKCGVCNLPCRVGLAQETQRPYMMCQGDCKFPFLSIKEQINLHVLAMNTLENRFKPHLGGTIPRCPGHQELATLLSPKKSSPQCHKIVGRLFFVCNKPQKEGGPCMVNGRRWNISADIRKFKPNTPPYNKEKGSMSALYGLNEHIKIAQDEQAARTAGAMYANALRDYKFQTGDFKPKAAPSATMGGIGRGGRKT